MKTPNYKIRDWNGLYSHGVITHRRHSSFNQSYVIKWSTKGKEWTSEKSVKDHLLKCAQKGILSEKWEVIKILEEPTKPISEWVDAKMLIKIIKT